MSDSNKDFIVAKPHSQWLKIGTKDGKRYVYWTDDGFIATVFTKDQAELMADLYDGTVEIR